MPASPDALPGGPANLTLEPVWAWLGLLVAEAAARRRAPRFGLDAAAVGGLVWRVPVAAWLGGRAAEVLADPLPFLERPRLLLAPPAGLPALLGAVVAASVVAAIQWRAARPALPALLDALGVPALLGLAVAALGLRDPRAVPLAVAWLLAAGVVGVLERQARCPGHVAAAAVVWGALGFVAADLARPLPGGIAGMSLGQLVAAAAAVAAYAWARVRAGP